MDYPYFRNFIELLKQAGRLKRVAVTFVIAATALLFTSCGTPGTRISQHPDIYQGLSSRDQALVSQGQIRVGMGMDAVWLAWGTPEQKIPGYGRGRPTETWVYLRYETPPSYCGPYY
jgi:outer membrane protein assembly factor BamE (lipoprotein component of BamABCDE complex)